MRRGLAALALVVGCEKASEPIVELRVARASPVAGEQILGVEDVVTDLAFTMDGGAHRVTNRWHTEVLVKNIAVDGHAVTVAEVTYKVIDEARELDGEADTVSDVRVGRSYTVSRQDGIPVAWPLEAPVNEQELLDVADDNEMIGAPARSDGRSPRWS